MRSSVLPLLLGFFLLQVLITATHWEDYKYGRQNSEPHKKTSHCTWKCFLFTLQWPGGFCQSLDNRTTCRIPENISNWTIHGLWPVGAKNCCRCWPMFPSDVQELELELAEQWPSFLKTKSSFHFWKDEWKKHGVCAACVEGMNSAHSYFQISLKLRGQFDIHKLLEDGGITPSCEHPYKLNFVSLYKAHIPKLKTIEKISDFSFLGHGSVGLLVPPPGCGRVAEVHNILAPHLSDKHEIQCVTDNKKREVWFQVKIPLSQNLTVGCTHGSTEKSPRAAGAGPGWSPSPGHPCPPQLPFYYFPINHQQPKQPCD